jgi:arylsulfatase
MRRKLALCLIGLTLAPTAALCAPANTASAAQPSTPAQLVGRGGFPQPPEAPARAPNILLVMTDDVGFGASGTFGGLVPTPNLDALAASGLRYNEFHTTAMCSPSRAALLTGRNHHSVAMGALVDLALPEDGYNARMPKSAATLAEILKENGYNTAMFGKHHDTPTAESSAAGPFDRWPTNLGFEYFYGFIGGETDQWHPDLVRGTSRIKPPAGEVLDKMLADDAIGWIHNQKAAAPDKPFFIYYAPGSTHAPLQAPAEWIEKFRGKFDQGWDKARGEVFARQKAMGIVPADTQLTPRPPFIPAWDSLSADQKRIAAHLMEVYAGELAYQDHEFGELIAELRRMGQLDNTLVIFVEGDNGASSEGGLRGTTNDVGHLVNRLDEPDAWMLEDLAKFGSPDAHNHYPMGWAWAANTPFKYFKRFASHLGGTRNAMVVSWPARIPEHGAVRSQFTHLVDVMPTILDAVGVKAPPVVDGVRQQPIDGASFAYTFAPNGAAAPSRHRVQYFELLGNRAIYQDGWMASTTPPDDVLDTTVHPGHTDPGDYKWELYDLQHDFSQARDLAQIRPDRLKALQALWAQEARRNHVLPLNNRVSPERNAAEQRAFFPPRPRYEYWGKDVEVFWPAPPPITSHSFVLTADVVVPSGPAKVSYEVSYRRPGPGADVTVRVDGRTVATGFVPRTVNVIRNFDVGHDSSAVIADAYAGDGAFPGAIEKVEVDLTDVSPTPKAPQPGPVAHR